MGTFYEAVIHFQSIAAKRLVFSEVKNLFPGIKKGNQQDIVCRGHFFPVSLVEVKRREAYSYSKFCSLELIETASDPYCFYTSFFSWVIMVQNGELSKASWFCTDEYVVNIMAYPFTQFVFPEELLKKRDTLQKESQYLVVFKNARNCKKVLDIGHFQSYQDRLRIANFLAPKTFTLNAMYLEGKVITKQKQSSGRKVALIE